MPNFAFYSGHKQAKRRNFLSLDMVPRNLVPGRFAYVFQSNWVGIIAIKTERTQILFFKRRPRSLPSRSWILKSIIIGQCAPSHARTFSSRLIKKPSEFLVCLKYPKFCYSYDLN